MAVVKQGERATFLLQLPAEIRATRLVMGFLFLQQNV